MNWRVEPDESVRTTGTTAIAGSARPGLSAAIAGSSHRVSTPVKIFAMFSPDRRRFVTRLVPIFRLYAKVVATAVSGMYVYPRVTGAGSPSAPYGTSDAAQSTVPCANFARPAAEPLRS